MKATFAICILALFILTSLLPDSSAQIRFPGSGGSGHGGFGGGGGFQHSPRPGPSVSRDKVHSTAYQEDTNSCNCLPLNACSEGKGQARHGCLTERQQEGICCQKQQGAPTIRTRNAQPITLPDDVLKEGVKRGQEAQTRILQQNQLNLKNGNFLARRTPARGHAYFFSRNPSAVAIHKQAALNARTSAEISRMQNLSPEQAFVSLQGISMPDRLRRPCSADEVPRCDRNARFRTVDGTCNNLQNPTFGKSETRFGRMSPQRYEDGVMAPRISSIDGTPLKPAREISNTILLDVNNPAPQMTLNVMQWAQFVDHDLTHVPFEDLDGEAIRCCENGRVVRNLPEQCFPIQVSPGDGFFRNFQEQCINFVRSMLALQPGCALGAAEQMNVLTHWLDGSMIYGSIEREASRVREPGTPFLKVSAGNLPPTDASIDCEARVPAPCFVAGDSRVNEQPGLTAMHTIWLREHNRIARNLQQLNPNMNPEQLFQETRRIVIAQIQHITYHEWLPIVLGPGIMQQYGLNRPSRYQPSINPSQFNEFATAAFRFGHSLVQGIYLLPSRTGRITSLRLRDVFNSPGLLQGDPSLVDSFVRSLTNQHSQNLDNFFTEDLTNHLFEPRGNRFGMDLMSLNIQRGRDHAIATYNDMRERFGGGRARNFIGLKSTIHPDLVVRLQTVYEFVDDIDLFVGGMTETPVPRGLLGPTFSNIIALQFSNVRNADRFFYDVPGQPSSFTPAQLSAIEGSSMARVFCDNSDVESMQPNAFLVPSNQNPKQPCNGRNIPSLNLQPWS